MAGICMDKCMCVVHLLYTCLHTWFDATRVYCFSTCGTQACTIYLS